MPGKEGLRAQRRSAGCNSDGAARARSRYRRWRATGRGRLSIDCAVMSREITTHDDAGRVGADHIVALALALRAAGDGGAGPMGRQHRSPSSEPAGSPYDARGRDSSCLSRATESNLSRSPSFPAARRQTSPAGKPHLTAGSTGTYAEFVIAACRRRVLETPMRPAQPRAVREAVSAGCLWSARSLLWRIQRP
jgi:hypothetical protein